MERPVSILRSLTTTKTSIKPVKVKISTLRLSNNTDKGNYRLSYTRLDYKGISRGSDLGRNTFNLNSTLKLHEKVSTDIVVNYINTRVHNRPEAINRVTANYSGFFSRADYMDAYLNKYQTSSGYKYVLYNQTDRNPDEAIKYNIRATGPARIHVAKSTRQ